MLYAVVKVDDAGLEIVLQIFEVFAQQPLALLRRVLEAGTDRVHDSLILQLTAVRRIVDHDGRVDAGAILPPVVQVLLDREVHRVCPGPRLLVWVGE